MALNVTNWVWSHSRATNGSLLVLLAIADEASRDGNTEMSILELAQKCHLSERAVQLAARELTRLGEVRVRPKAGSHARNGYRVIMVRGEDIAPLGGEDSAPPTIRRGEDSAPPKNLHPEESAPRKPDKPQVRPGRGEDSAPRKISDVLKTTTSTGRSEVQAKEASEAAPRPDVERVCAHLASRIEANGSRRPVVTRKWRDAARLMIDRDGRTEQQVIAAIDWSQDHEFWRSNILSMPKLREKYDQLRLQASRANGSPKSVTAQRVQQAREAGRRAGAIIRGER